MRPIQYFVSSLPDQFSIGVTITSKNIFLPLVSKLSCPRFWVLVFLCALVLNTCVQYSLWKSGGSRNFPVLRNQHSARLSMRRPRPAAPHPATPCHAEPRPLMISCIAPAVSHDQGLTDLLASVMPVPTRSRPLRAARGRGVARRGAAWRGGAGM